jgi:hypothetical protein
LSGPSRSALGPLIALAILLALLVAVGALTVAPLWRLIQGYNQDLAELEQRLLIQRRVAAGAAGLQSRLQELEGGFARDGHYLKSTSQTLAAAEIQDLTKRAILSKRGQVLSSQIVGVEPERGAQRVTLGVTLRASLAQVVQIFHLLETGDPFLFIDSANIRARNLPLVSGIPGAQPPPQPLDVQIQLSGYFTPGPT